MESLSPTLASAHYGVLFIGLMFRKNDATQSRGQLRLPGVGVAFKIYCTMAWRAGKTGLLQSAGEDRATTGDGPGFASGRSRFTPRHRIRMKTHPDASCVFRR